MPTNKKGYMGDYYHKNKNKFNNPTERKKRAERNKARRLTTKAKGVKSIKGRDVDHITPLSKNGKTILSNLRALSRKKNRGRK